MHDAAVCRVPYLTHVPACYVLTDATPSASARARLLESNVVHVCARTRFVDDSRARRRSCGGVARALPGALTVSCCAEGADAQPSSSTPSARPPRRCRSSADRRVRRRRPPCATAPRSASSPSSRSRACAGRRGTPACTAFTAACVSRTRSCYSPAAVAVLVTLSRPPARPSRTRSRAGSCTGTTTLASAVRRRSVRARAPADSAGALDATGSASRAGGGAPRGARARRARRARRGPTVRGPSRPPAAHRPAWPISRQHVATAFDPVHGARQQHKRTVAADDPRAGLDVLGADVGPQVLDTSDTCCGESSSMRPVVDFFTISSNSVVQCRCNSANRVAFASRRNGMLGRVGQRQFSSDAPVRGKIA